MYLLSVNLYEFGQYLQILLWISLPAVIIALLVTTYLHYRNRRRREEEGPDAPYQSGDRLVNDPFSENPAASLQDESGNAYRGLLWMKEKYEQYRDQTDGKYERLKEELARSEKKYLDLLGVRSSRENFSGQTMPDKTVPHKMIANETIPDKMISLFPNAPKESPLPQSSAPAGAPPLYDPIEEKDRHIGLLQLELDQRIRDYHLLEYQDREDRARIEELTGQYSQAQELLNAHQEKIEEQQKLLETQREKTKEQQELQEAQRLKAEEQKELLNAHRDKIEELNALLGQEKNKVTDLTAKLEGNIGLLLRIHRELNRSLGKNGPDSAGASPVPEAVNFSF